MCIMECVPQNLWPLNQLFMSTSNIVIGLVLQERPVVEHQETYGAIMSAARTDLLSYTYAHHVDDP